MVDINNFIIVFKCLWIKRLIKLYKFWMDIFYIINGYDFLQKLYDFGDIFVLECLYKENNVFFERCFLFFVMLYKDD